MVWLTMLFFLFILKKTGSIERLRVGKGVIIMDRLFETDIDLEKFKPYTIDCGKCCGLCCVALYFSKTEGFPENKEAGRPCRNLQNDFKCKVHSRLYSQGLHGCMAYDCFGAGQQVTGRISLKPDWKTMNAGEADSIFQSYLTMLHLHQTLWYLTEASVLLLSEYEREQIRHLLGEGKGFTKQPLDKLQNLDVEPFRERANTVLKGISAEIASGFSVEFNPDVFKDYLGKNFKRKKLRGKDFSMSLLIAADLEQSDLQGANFLGADMRDTNIRNTDLSHALFLTQIQINGAKGNENTILPPYLKKPSTWESK